MLPLAILAAGALLAGYLNFPLPHLGNFLGQSPSIHSFPPTAAESAAPGHVSNLMIASALISIAGILLAYLLHLQNRALDDRLALALGPITRLLEAKYWVDEIYQGLIVRPLWTAGEYFYRFDVWIVDILVDMVGWVLQLTGYLVKFSTQRGYLQGYASAMLLGLAAILLLIFMNS
jgi:NADH-quinone oxidoreductase subunit L